MVEEKAKLRKYWTDQSVNLALQGKWEEAAAANQTILTLFPSDAEAYNRLGKAYTELGRYVEARDAYSHALQIDPSNSIANKNLQRLTRLMETAARPDIGALPPPTAEFLKPQIFIEEMGKTGTTTLINPSDPGVLARMSAGDPVRLCTDGRTLVVQSLRGERLGEVEARLSHRLIAFMNAGNQYVAAISSLENSVRVIIRETFQHPSQAGRVSFPVKGGEGFRSYIKDSVLKYDLDDEDDDGDEPDFAVEGDGTGDEAAEDAEPFDDEMGNSSNEDKS
jgi:tetratricopeptide (TPR) repeat protein